MRKRAQDIIPIDVGIVSRVNTAPKLVGNRQYLIGDYIEVLT